MSCVFHVDVELVSPLILGGANPRAFDDPPVLRPPSIRGMLRFWTRALGGGDPTEIGELERRLWGSIPLDTDGGRGGGQRVSLIGAARLDPRGIAKRMLFPHKDEPQGKERDPRSWTPMAMPNGGALFRIHFRVPSSLDHRDLDQLRGVVWTWLHLGGIGRRSNRGFGSLLWRPEGEQTPGSTSLLAGFVELEPTRDLADRRALELYLLRGLAKVATVFEAREPKAALEATNGRTWPSLYSIDQVLVGRPLERDGRQLRFTGDGGTLESLIHGVGPNRLKGGEVTQKQLDVIRKHFGKAFDGRRPSPIRWRLFPTPAGLVPVMVWFPVDGEVHLPKSDPRQIYDALGPDGLGFDESLLRAHLGTTPSAAPENAVATSLWR